jgi:D-alanine-D-alanine ligase
LSQEGVPLSPSDVAGDGGTEKASLVAVLFGGPSPEHDVSILTGLQAARELMSTGRQVTGIYWSKAGVFHRVSPELEASDFLEGIPRDSDPLRLLVEKGGGFVTAGSRFGRNRRLEIAVVVNCCHGGPGEDGSLQGALDLASVSYTGPTASGAALGMDKLSFAGVVAAAGLPALPRVALDEATSELSFGGPYIVKPRFGGSSLGVEVVADLDTARARLQANVHLRDGAVVEPYRADLFDLNVAIRSWPSLSLSAIERPLRSESSTEILEYTDKYAGAEGMASAPRELPAVLPDSLADSMRDMARAAAHLCELRGIARVDFLSDGHAVFLNEINTVPGSLARYLWVDPTVPFAQLLDDMIAEAVKRPSARYTSTGADGSVLKMAGAIASKLA